VCFPGFSLSCPGHVPAVESPALFLFVAFSAEMLKDLGLKWVVIGHSERRHILKESDEVRIHGSEEGCIGNCAFAVPCFPSLVRLSLLSCILARLVGYLFPTRHWANTGVWGDRGFSCLRLDGPTPAPTLTYQSR
jgi:hypothetical protein